MKIISELLTAKYGKPYAEECRKESINTISEKLKHKMSVQSPPKILVEKYLIEIAKIYNVNYVPDPQIIKEGEPPIGKCLSFDNNGIYDFYLKILPIICRRSSYRFWTWRQ